MSMLEDAVRTGKIKTALLTDEFIDAGGINVNTVDRVVTLEGTVPAAVERELAEEVATRHGAREVRNWLEVHGEPVPEPTSPMATGALGRVTTPPGAPPSRRPDLGEAVRHALAEDRRVNEHLLEVQVENNSVFLSGRQGDVDARNAAIETAAHVPGVVGVVDDIEIMPAV
jgi:osmotically-inducible protein OsmY